MSTATEGVFWPSLSFPSCARRVSVTGSDRECQERVGVSGLPCSSKITHYVAFPALTFYATLVVQTLHLHLLMLKMSQSPLLSHLIVSRAHHLHLQVLCASELFASTYDAASGNSSQATGIILVSIVSVVL